ncbi:hypothetical protein FB382_002895 [Nocardioides ginsengisegetis]|uniref:ChsH2 C-terminal OB-fold domain-containing protein n=1 Tax=Nocardioides ginsengisegetis TaxID=661491 RepID=A0A7W3J1Q3_9ACTN|nr:OB-fold domain-containing protein [Nocardioides ginsengisegetis]MBA8804604.1 hypothetical protein [Nocardioides ginsengisegetis]
MATTPVIEGWFTTGPDPALVGSQCTTCGNVAFPPTAPQGFCRNPACDGEEFEDVKLSRHGTVWSYTDAQYQPPPPYVAADPFEPFALAAVELPEGLVVLGQVTEGYGVQHLHVGAEVELVVEELDPGHTIWRWKPVVELGEEAEQ